MTKDIRSRESSNIFGHDLPYCGDPGRRNRIRMVPVGVDNDLRLQPPSTSRGEERLLQNTSEPVTGADFLAALAAAPTGQGGPLLVPNWQALLLAVLLFCLHY